MADTLTAITVEVQDTPSIKEVMDRARMAYLGLLMEQEDSHVPSVARRLGCTEANVRKSIGSLVKNYGTDGRGEGQGKAP